MEKLRVAVPKGNSSISALFLNKGYALPDDFSVSRKYIVPIINTNLEFILAKPTDIPAYVEYGAADLGIVGKEALLEEDRDVYELLDLGISIGSLSLIGKSESLNSNPKVATAYPKTALNYFNQKGKEVEIIKLHGGSELALVTGLADYIVEVNDEKLMACGLVELEKICNASYRLIANRVSYQVKRESLGIIYRELSQSVAAKQKSL
ncbi:ATP phosphoribosyltransferase [Paenibacillus senegalensis]|uniref:ATP phosphoribosyltransferase n=1 Tax=Paenibacillus senegalensis TaxID=1465766 RepID=UPI00028A1524|nr:ATP phosphoribosyltransferase [Paenibacillus senegalensis]